MSIAPLPTRVSIVARAAGRARTHKKMGRFVSRPSLGETERSFRRSDRCRTHLPDCGTNSKAASAGCPAALPSSRRAVWVLAGMHTASLGAEPAVRLRPLHCQYNLEVYARALPLSRLFVAQTEPLARSSQLLAGYAIDPSLLADYRYRRCKTVRSDRHVLTWLPRHLRDGRFRLAGRACRT